MSRKKRIVRFSDSLISEIQEYANLDETIKELQERYYDPELSEYIESQNNCAYFVIESLARMLNIKGKPDLTQIEEEYEYYDSRPRYKYSLENSVKPKYKKKEKV